jgi:PhnB protein
VDAVADRAVASGATIVRAIENQFYGDRSGQFRDPFGHLWNVSTHVEDVTPEEIERRSKAYVEAKAAQA